jgi:hypothetical protein
VFVHNARSGDELYRVPQGTPLRQVVFSADGTRPVTSADTGTTSIWITH